MDFNQIIGHDNQIQALKNSIRNKKINHCYLFEGEIGLGKKDIALAFSKTLLCKEGKESPCNKCNSCIKFDSGNHPDFKTLAPKDKLIRKEDVDKLISSMAILPFESERKIFIIEDCDMMRIESQNALLKTLEEPPGYINIILISQSSRRILPTILSRCQIIKFYPLEIDKIVDLLIKDYKIDEKKAAFIANFTKGSFKRSVELVKDEKFFELRDETIKIVDSLIRGDKVKALSSTDFFNNNKDNIDGILDIILFWFRDLIIYKKIGDSPLIINRDRVEILYEQSLMDLNKINDIIYKIEETKININRNINFGLSIETMLLSI